MQAGANVIKLLGALFGAISWCVKLSFWCIVYSQPNYIGVSLNRLNKDDTICQIQTR